MQRIRAGIEYAANFRSDDRIPRAAAVKLVAELLNLQDPDKPHTLLTRLLISLIILFASLVYTLFFGVLAAVATYLVGVELMGLDLRWMYAPIVIAILIGLKDAASLLTDYWRNYGHG
jgi:hypothetical protein